jgi:hypothetical protein
MPKFLGERVEPGRITRFNLSNAWYVLTPWTHKGNPTGYISKYVELSDCGRVLFTYWYIGPLGIISGKWVGEENVSKH